MNDNGLKPCPFCGGKALMGKETFNGYGYSYTNYFVFCEKCGARGLAVDDYSGRVNLEKARECWNRRVNENEKV